MVTQSDDPWEYGFRFNFFIEKKKTLLLSVTGRPG